MKILFTLALTTAAMVVATEALGQPPAGPNGKEFKLKRFSPAEAVKDSRESLVGTARNLQITSEATAVLLAEAAKSGDTSVETKARINLLAMIAMKDRVAMLAPIAGATKQLRADQAREEAAVQSQMDSRQADAKTTETEVDELADKAYDSAENAKTATDPDVKTKLERDAQSYRAQLAAKVALRDDRYARVKDCQASLERIRKDQKSLDDVDQWLNTQSELSKTHLARLLDNVSDSTVAGLRKETAASAELLEKLVSSLGTNVDPRTIGEVVTPPDYPPINGLVPKAAPTTDMRVDEAIQKAAARRGQPMPKTKP